MRHENVEDDLRELVFDFFFRFSKFESALKEERYLNPDKVGAKANPHWGRFVADHRADYKPNSAAQALMDAKPQRQIVGKHELDFEEVPFPANTPDLDRVVTFARTVRNSLFHGGKHGSAYWDDPDRMRLLLKATRCLTTSLGWADSSSTTPATTDH